MPQCSSARRAQKQAGAAWSDRCGRHSRLRPRALRGDHQLPLFVDPLLLLHTQAGRKENERRHVPVVSAWVAAALTPRCPTPPPHQSCPAAPPHPVVRAPPRRLTARRTASLISSSSHVAASRRSRMSTLVFTCSTQEVAVWTPRLRVCSPGGPWQARRGQGNHCRRRSQSAPARTLFTFWPPAPELRANWMSTSSAGQGSRHVAGHSNAWAWEAHCGRPAALRQPSPLEMRLTGGIGGSLGLGAAGAADAAGGWQQVTAACRCRPRSAATAVACGVQKTRGSCSHTVPYAARSMFADGWGSGGGPTAARNFSSARRRGGAALRLWGQDLCKCLGAKLATNDCWTLLGEFATVAVPSSTAPVGLALANRSCRRPCIVHVHC